jgi:coproporphyrinogen III oxidase
LFKNQKVDCQEQPNAATATAQLVKTELSNDKKPWSDENLADDKKVWKGVLLDKSRVIIKTAQAKISHRMSTFVKNLQQQIISEISSIDGKPFQLDYWEKKGFGYGLTGVLQDGNVFEKAGVNISVVNGVLPAAAAKQMAARKNQDFGPGPHNYFVAGISLVLHPKNPMAPTVHLNYRYFEIQNPKGPEHPAISWWFGGGADLTPSYLFDEDATHFHNTLKQACDKHNSDYYPRFKKWCDNYFYIDHRKESRGIGGLFFDDLDSDEPQKLFEFVKSCGEAFLPSYAPLVRKRKDSPFDENQKLWQQLRRGRYVEFNLVYDRGTKFGLATPNARIESILMSLPLTARWQYCHEPTVGSEESKILQVLMKPKEWATV